MLTLKILFLAMLATTTSCRQRKDNSKVKIDDGYLVAESGSFMPGVVAIGSKPAEGKFNGTCSATTVSPNTLVTAAHCVSMNKSDAKKAAHDDLLVASNKLCVALPSVDGENIVCGGEAFFPSAYYKENTPEDELFDHDIAVIVFPKDTFTYVHNIDLSSSPKAGDQAIIVGFSKHFLPDEEYSKRWGRAKIFAQPLPPALPRDAVIISTKIVSNPDEHAVSPGDSGGSMLSSACNLVGVASRMGSSRGMKNSFHTRINFESSRTFLALAAKHTDASICGLTKTCEGNHVFVKAEVDGALKFPCKAPMEDQDPVIIAAMKRVQEQSQTAKSKNRDPIHCRDSEALRIHSGYVSMCVESVLLSSSEQNTVCSGDYIHLDGTIAKTAPRQEESSAAIVAVFGDVQFGDLALNKKTTSLTPDHISPLSCKNQTDRSANKCCFKVRCKALRVANRRAIVDKEVACVGLDETAVFLKTLNMAQNRVRQNKLIPNKADLETLPFSCKNTMSLSWRTNYGVCWEDKRVHDTFSPSGPVYLDEDLVEGQDFVCWQVKEGLKTDQKKPCPKGVKDVFVKDSEIRRQGV
jgi:hypothetical protein